MSKYTSTRYELYLNKLGLNTIFELQPNSTNSCLYIIQHPVTTDTGYLHLQYTPGGGMNITIGYGQVWSTIDFASYTERKVKICEYLAANGFKQAEPLLREHKIDTLTKNQ